MKHTLTTAVLLTLALATHATAADPETADPETIARLDQALKAVATFQHGAGSGPLRDVERIVFQLPTDDPSRQAIEQRLLETLRATTTADGKRFLCTQLRVIGTGACVPALKELLTDPEVSHAAVYALGRMEVSGAVGALADALDKTSGDLQAAIINALADRGVCQACSAFRRLLGSSDPNVAQAAARALGRIGAKVGADSTGLIEARRNAAGELALEIDNALLECADRLAAKNLNDEAAAVYETLYEPGPPVHVRSAALRGLVLTRGKHGVGLLRNAITADDPDLRRNAISLVPLAEGDRATLALAAAMHALPPEDQVLLLRALGLRGDAAASGVMWAATRSPHQPVRIAAIEALGKVADVAVVPELVRIAAKTQGTEKSVARASLVSLTADGVDRRLIELTGGTDAPARVEAISALAARRTVDAVTELLHTARDEDASVRRESIRALGTLAGRPQLWPMVALVLEPKDPDDLSAVEAAVERMLLRIEDKPKAADTVIAALKSPPPEARPVLLRLLGRTAAPKALGYLRGTLKSTDPAAVDAAVLAIARWPHAAVVDDLLGLIANAASRDHKTTALEGFVRLAAASEDPAAMYVRVLKLVQQTADRKLVLAALGESDSSNSPQVLELAQKFLEDEQLGPTAGLATLRIANRLKNKHAELARAALDKVIQTVDHDDVRRRAQEVINDIQKHDDHILQWVGVGPFTEKGKRAEQVFEIVFPPEKAGFKDVEWQPITKGIGSWEVNLEATFGGLDHCAAYVRTCVRSPVEQEAQLEMGSDDACKAWLNGKLVYDTYGGGGVTPRQKRVPVKLQKGLNDLILKVVDNQGGWAFCCRLRQPDGTALPGLEIAP